MKTELLDFCVEELDPFVDEYVYDIEMEDSSDHVFFANDILVHNSVMIDISKILEYCKIPLHINNEVTKKAHKIIDYYGDYLNSEIRKWAISELNSTDPRFVFKREKICDVVVLQKKKFYILHILDNEGFPCNKFVYKGIEVAKSIMSKDVKTLIKSNLETTILSRDVKQARKLFYEAYEIFCKMDAEQISFRKRVNDYDKGENGYIDGKFAKGL